MVSTQNVIVIIFSWDKKKSAEKNNVGTCLSRTNLKSIFFLDLEIDISSILF